MKWLRSTTNLTYTFDGKTIPAYDKKPLQVSDSQFEKMSEAKVIASLIKNNGIIVLKEYKDDSVQNSDAEKRLQAQQAQIQALQSDLAKAKQAIADEETLKKASQFDELKAEAEKTIADKDAEIATLKAQLEASKSKSKKSSKDEEA